MKFVADIVKTPLFRITSLNGISVIVKILGGLISSKVVAEFLGPAGIGLVGNFRYFLSFIDTFSTLGFQHGIIKYTAENEKNTEKLRTILATVFITITGVIVVLSLLLLLLANYLSGWVFTESGRYSWLFRVLALSLPWYTGNIIVISVLNGLGNYKKVILLNMWGNIAGVLLSAVLIWQLEVTGAFLGLVLYPVFLFFFSFYLLHRSFPVSGFFRMRYFDAKVLRGLFSYSLMSLITALLSPYVYLTILNMLRQDFSPEEAGFWEGINRISSFYMLFVTTLLTVWFLPKLSTAKSTAETRETFGGYYRTIVPIFLAGITVIYLLRDFIVRLLLSEEFLPMENLFFWQLVGDFFKVLSLIMGYQFLAKKMTRQFIITEILSFAVLYFSSVYLIGLYGSEGAVMAHAFTYGIYFLMLAVYFLKNLSGRRTY